MSIQTGRMSDLEAEKMILAMMVVDKAIIPNIKNAVQERDFFDAFNREIFKAIVKLDAQGVADVRSINRETGNKDSEYIDELLNTTCSSANWEYYVKDVKKFSQVRGTLALVEYLSNVTPKTVEESISDAITVLTRLANISGGSSIRTTKDLIPQVISEIEEAYKNKGKLVGLDTKLDGINDMLDGWPNDYIIIGARPSAGKTALAGTLIRNIASQDVPVGFVTIEMKDTKIVKRLISGMSGINSRSMRNGLLSQANFKQIEVACAELYEQNIFFDDMSSDLERLKQSCRTMARIHKCKALFIDHAGMVTVQNDTQHWEKMSLISRTIKNLQRELDISITLLSQLKPDAEGREPTMADLKGTSGFGEDADTILLLHRERVATAGQPGIAIPSMLKSVKTRDGDIGDIPLMFFPQITTFRDPPKK